MAPTENSDDEIVSEEEGSKIVTLFTTVLTSIFWIMWCLLTMLVVVYVLASSLMLYSTQFKMEIIFSNRIRTPWFADITDCKSFGVAKCENVYFNGPAGKLGAWFISPASTKYITKEAYILYLHGNTGSRALEHRIQMYKKLSKMGYHVLAVDYRGFGDSDGWPTEQGVVEDSKRAYQWLMEKAHGHAVYIWGHSLGSAVGLQLASILNAERSRVNGLFLEAPFNNMTDGIKYNALASPIFQHLPSLEEYLDDMKNVFRSSYWIQKVTSPTLILHDVSDHIINVVLARRLYQSAKIVGTTNVKMIELDENLFHNYIYNARKFQSVVSDFIHFTS